jgi:hypothetical protein
MKLEDVIKSSQVIVHDGRYAYLKAKGKQPGDHFLVAQDNDEVTIVTEEGNLEGVKYDSAEKWFKLIEIQVSAPFVATGFLATITGAIAAKNLNLLVVSTFSKDYILVREEEHQIALQALSEAGFPLKR